MNCGQIHRDMVDEWLSGLGLSGWEGDSDYQWVPSYGVIKMFRNYDKHHPNLAHAKTHFGWMSGLWIMSQCCC